MASQDIVPRVVASELPYVHILDPRRWKDGLCFSCFRKTQHLRRCVNCRVMMYCDKQCQARDWKKGHHRHECKLFSDKNKFSQIESEIASARMREMIGIRTHLPTTAHLLIAKMWARLCADGGHSDESELDRFPVEAGRRTFADLMSHTEQIPDNEVEKHWNKFQSLFGDDTLFRQFTRENLKQFVGIITTNMFGIERLELDQTSPRTIGSGLYMQMARFNHACSAQLDRSFVGTRMLLLERNSVKNLPFNELKICYAGDLLATTADRQKDLREMWHFDCDCSMCQDVPGDLIKQFGLKELCLKCSECLVLLPNPTGPIRFEAYPCCPRCDYVSGTKASAELHKIMEFIQEEVAPNVFTSPPTQLNDIHAKAQELLHPVKNVHLMTLGQECNSYVRERARPEDTELCLQMFDDFLKCYDFYDYSTTWLRCAHICKFAEDMLENVGRTPEAMEYCKKARGYLIRYTGEGHHCIEEFDKLFEEKYGYLCD